MRSGVFLSTTCSPMSSSITPSRGSSTPTTTARLAWRCSATSPASGCLMPLAARDCMRRNLPAAAPVVGFDHSPRMVEIAQSRMPRGNAHLPRRLANRQPETGSAVYKFAENSRSPQNSTFCAREQRAPGRSPVAQNRRSALVGRRIAHTKSGKSAFRLAPDLPLLCTNA